jgi:hypothetical protein
MDGQMTNWLLLVQRVAERYMVPPWNVRYFQVWNELKGYYNPVLNHWRRPHLSRSRAIHLRTFAPPPSAGSSISPGGLSFPIRMMNSFSNLPLLPVPAAKQVTAQEVDCLHLGMAQPKSPARFNPGPQLLGNEYLMFCGHTDSQPPGSRGV